MIRFCAVLLLVLPLVSGCSRVVYQTQLVEVEVIKPCVDSVPAEPVYETGFIRSDDGLDPAVTAYLVERQQMRLYIKTLRAELVGCLKPGE